jgi:S-DNA-T family DNA segregation ATPase FtsK/SpoIIIE
MPRPNSQSNLPQSGIAGVSQSATKRFVITPREPWNLPEDPVELPGPGELPPPPPSINLLTSILPPALMLVMAIITIVSSGSFLAAGSMLIMGLGFPMANLIGNSAQKKKYEKSLAQREANYQTALQNERMKLFSLVQQQRQTLEAEYPSLDSLASIAAEHTKRLWWRRPNDEDFLSIRIGKGMGKPSFNIQPPKMASQSDPLVPLSFGVINEFQSTPEIPLLLNLRQTGSVAIAGNNISTIHKLTRRLVLDLIVHHSPQDVHIALLANTKGAEERWAWLKWVPHTGAFSYDVHPQRINYSEAQIDEYLKFLQDELNNRMGQDDRGSSKRRASRAAIVVLLDDDDLARQTPEIAQIAQYGFENGIYLIFVGGQNWPRECRSRLDISSEKDFVLTQTWNVSGRDSRLIGEFESASAELCENIARSIAGLEVAGGQSIVQLPESIRVSQVLGNSPTSLDAIKERWSREFASSDLLRFPIGVRAGRETLEPMVLDLRPAGLGGEQAFHTVLFGTTGSGKSVCMQSMILTAAYLYPPSVLNFLLMDFKGGASALTRLKELGLPHCVGNVTDLNTELTKRALTALDSEFKRRKQIFEKVGNPENLFVLNERYPDKALPHLLIVLDEFSKGFELLPEMQPVLQTLVSQGRALGMYLLLANQKVTAAVDSLLANIGWRIVLRVEGKDEMRMIDPSLPITSRPGHGYIRVKEQVYEFQGSRSDQPVLKAAATVVDEFKVNEVLPDGNLQKLYTYVDSMVQSETTAAPKLSELEAYVSLMIQCQKELNIKPARPIYIDPLPDEIELTELIVDSEVQQRYAKGKWDLKNRDGKQPAVPLGYLDIPEESLQEPFNINFSDKDGHLWIIGAPGSGKAMTLTTLLLSLAQVNTPEEAQIYILEFGAGELKQLEDLPHVGSVIRLHEKEKVQRLLNYLDHEFEKRTAHENTLSEVNIVSQPAIYLVINNFAEMSANYQDEILKLSRFIRDGKAARIHLIISTNRGPDLSRSLSSNISRRLVLQLASTDEYIDIINKKAPALSSHAKGHGIWVDADTHECQVASFTGSVKTFAREMSKAWTGVRPYQIGTMPSCISNSDLLERQKSKKFSSGVHIPVGIAYDTLDLISPDLLRELPTWLILGGRETGKSNFLACAAESVLQNDPEAWKVNTFSLRRSPLAALSKRLPSVECFGTIKSATARLQDLIKVITEHEECDTCRYLLLVDDLGAFFEMGAEEANTALNNLVTSSAARRDVYIMATGVADELRAQLSTPIMKQLRQSHTGIALSNDPSDLDWLGGQLPLIYKKMEFPAGRGFFVTKGKQTFIQTPFFGECAKKNESE